MITAGCRHRGHVGGQLRRGGRTHADWHRRQGGQHLSTYAVDGDGDGISSVYSPADAIFTAASYLCRCGGGKGGDLSRAVFAYNHADWCVTKVLAIASIYEAAAPPA